MEQKLSKKQILKKLFFSTLYLSTFTFGGGYIIVSLMKNKFVDELHWIDETEMMDLISIAQSSPGLCRQWCNRSRLQTLRSGRCWIGYTRCNHSTFRYYLNYFGILHPISK